MIKSPSQKFSIFLSLAVASAVLFTNTNFAAIVSMARPMFGPVAYWPGDGNANDTAGGNNGSLIGDVSFVKKAIARKAFAFDGSRSFVAIPNSPAFNFNTRLTIEFWMKANSDNELNSYQGLVASDFFGVEISNGNGGVMGVNFYTSSDAGASWGEISSANGGGAVISPGQWYHIAGVYDGAKVQLFIDGKPWGNAFPCSGKISPMLPDSYLSIGGEDGRTFCGCTERYFNGFIDEVKIYNRSLSAGEIKASFDKYKFRKNNPL